MRELAVRGHQPGEVYPSTAVDIDVTDGVVKPRPSAQLLFASPQGSILDAYYHPPTGKYLLVTRSGMTDYLYLRTTSNVLLSSWTEAIEDPVVSFVPFGDRVVVVCRSRIFIVDVHNNTAVQVVKPSAPSGVTAFAKQQYLTVTNWLAAQADRATVTQSSPFLKVEDLTSDPNAGAYQQLYATSAVDVAHCDEVWARIEHYSSNLLSPSQLTPISDIRLNNQDFYAGAAADAMQVGWVRMPLTGSRLRGVHVFVQQGYINMHERIYYTPRMRPREYRIVRVQNGFESDPFDKEVTVFSDNCPTPGGYVVELGNLPSGTWRIYRRDALGVWWLVQEGTGSTFTDTKREEELGERWYEPVYPHAGGNGAIAWQGRIVLNGGAGKLYISEVGEYAWREDSDVLQLPTRLHGMAVIGGRLYLNHSGAWWELIGAPGSWLQRKVLEGNCPRPALGIFLSDCALAAEGRLYLPVGSQWLEVDLQDSHFWAWGVYQGMVARGTNCVYILQRGRWVKWTEPARAIWYANGRYEVARQDGVYALSGAPVNSAQVSETLPLPMRVATARFYVDGSGQVTASLNNSTPETWNLPVYRERWRMEDWEMSLSLSLSAGAQIKRILWDGEASASYG